MHVLASDYRSEFLATPQLLRFDYAKGRDRFEPTLLIKGSTLLLKYIVFGVPLQLGFARLGGRLLYGLKVYDDDKKVGVLWSLLENDREKAAICALARGEQCQIFLFNELAVNVAWTPCAVSVDAALNAMVEDAATGRVDHSTIKVEAASVLARFHVAAQSGAGLIVTDVQPTIEWKPIRNTFITSHADGSPIELFDKNEGNQQEQIGVWLTDNLHPRGVFHNPQIPKGNGRRELTDILLSHEFGSILIESKAITIFARQSLPNRTKLSHDIAGHIKKAVAQLKGAVRRVKDGTIISTIDGKPIDVERTQPIHGIVLIPDLELIQDPESYGISFIKEFMKATGGFLHFLDISELLRIVQAAEMISSRGKKTTPIMAFDYYLVERAKKAIDAGTLCIEVLLRFADE